MNWIITAQHEGLMVRTYLQREKRFSKRLLKQVIHGGTIQVNHATTTARHILKDGDVLSIRLPEEKKGAMMTPEKMPLAILYEDDAVLVLNKPAGRASIPSINHSSGTMANGVLAYYAEKGLPYTFHIVTRLDRNTSGVMLVAKHSWSHSLLAEAQRNGVVEPTYYTIIEGHLKQKQGSISAPIGRKDGSIIERTVRSDGKKALTHYQVVKETTEHTCVLVRLVTGRTHQIRVHFAHMGHPIAGDDLYGGALSFFKRQALHCYQLTFVHPVSSERMTFNAELADDLQFPC
ncbi:RluA family pseudouridine synthase [Barrientosiimonas marina]|uniref:Pseudouridine synthase n=1 Tax=Lentibacillus kimchii TaxID=1542911 RepID=A0ABW2UT01_9BACI